MAPPIEPLMRMSVPPPMAPNVPPPMALVPAPQHQVVSTREEDSMNLEPSQSGKPIVGIIYPPPEIRNIVDKTASFVARNGVEFENRIKTSEQGNPKFNFLTPTDPYHAYYRHKVKEIGEGIEMEPSIPRPSLPKAVQEAVKAVEFVPKNPPPDFEFAVDPSSINPFELDLIKLTALFAARNGRQFLTQLMNREARNFQFDFLKPQHSNFPYFTKQIEQYTKVIIPPKDIREQLVAELGNPQKVLDDVKYRVAWARHEKKLRDEQEAAAERERLAYAQIDWHDFVVVQTVDFQPGESVSLPPPCTPADVGARVLAQQRQDAARSATQDVEMEVESDEDDELPEKGQHEDKDGAGKGAPTEASVPAAPMPAMPQNVLVKKDYKPKPRQVANLASEEWVISPLTGERIPASKMHEHMRYNTVDSQYFMQKEKEQAEKQDEPVFASGVDVSANIQKFAERRTDIFGVGERAAEQTAIGKKLGEEDESIGVDPRTIWDGHASTIESTTRRAMSRVTIDQQLADLKRAHGFANDPPDDKDRPAHSGGGGQQRKTVQVPAPMPPAVPPPMQQQRPPPPPPPAENRPPPPPPPSQPSAGPPGSATAANLAPLGSRPPSIPPLAALTPALPSAAAAAPVAQASGFVSGVTMAAAKHGQAPANPIHMAPPVRQEEEPWNKRARLESELVPENDFAARYTAPYQIKVSVPASSEKSDWKLDGQNINMLVTVMQQVSELKQRIQDETSVPISKQKLSHDGAFLKDGQTLAYYNIASGSTLQLVIKERGGRKK